MPTVQDLLDELQQIGVDPSQVRIPSRIFDVLAERAEDIADEENEPEET